MVRISSHIGCRQCLYGFGIPHYWNLDGADSEVYKNKTEYEVMIRVEQMRERKKLTCKACGSSNVEVLDVEIENKKLYNLDSIKNKVEKAEHFFLILNIDTHNSQIEFSQEGSSLMTHHFLEAAIKHVYKIMSIKPNINFIPHNKGNFFVCITGGGIGDVYLYSEGYTEIEKLRYCGISKEDIIDAIMEFAEINNISCL